MKRKIIAVILTAFTFVGLVSCSNSKTDSNTNEVVAQEINGDSNPNEKTKDGVKLILESVTKQPVKGDRTQDNVVEDNGEYFANGSDIAKAIDYEYITVKIKIENSTDKAITLSENGWSAKMEDGYRLKNCTLSKELKEQIASNNFIDGEVKILAQKKLNVQNFELSYNLIDYTNFDKMVSDAISGKSENQCKREYPELFKENYIKFNIEVK
ncbi:hypothetical protein [Clostridium butyricum]|jgi:hypothetical protein|uniref:hypothetical protein n=1 Tax=Clostridium butyricum TaxID=1492 RepID=UPI00232BDCEC|nr:hypothetical protein [Clostridium butyricum]MDB2161496.1 hypothetical protein [Clostridium butyricum]